MVIGVVGLHGEVAVHHVETVERTEQGSATTQKQRTEELVVKEAHYPIQAVTFRDAD